MKKLKFGTGITIFFLFFGLATFDAFSTRDWIRATFWIATGVIFLLADNLKKESRGIQK